MKFRSYHLTSISLSISLVFLQLLTRFEKSRGATTSLVTFKKNVCREEKGGEATLPTPPDATCMASEDRPNRRPYPCTIGNVQPLRDDVLYTHMANVSVPFAYKMYIRSGSYKVIRTSPCIYNKITVYHWGNKSVTFLFLGSNSISRAKPREIDCLEGNCIHVRGFICLSE